MSKKNNTLILYKSKNKPYIANAPKENYNAVPDEKRMS